MSGDFLALVSAHERAALREAEHPGSERHRIATDLTRQAVLDAAAALRERAEAAETKLRDCILLRCIEGTCGACAACVESALRARAEAAEKEVARLRQAHWDGRAVGGFDNDGDPTPRAVVSDFAALILSDWREERATHDELMAENEAAEKARDEARRDVLFVLDGTEQKTCSRGCTDPRCQAIRRLYAWARALPPTRGGGNEGRGTT
jgi:hypothetical protein